MRYWNVREVQREVEEREDSKREKVKCVYKLFVVLFE